MQGICADRSYIAQNLYDDVAAQGCNVFLAPSAGAGNTTVRSLLASGLHSSKSASMIVRTGLGHHALVSGLTSACRSTLSVRFLPTSFGLRC